MTTSVRHAKVSVKSDSGDTTLVRPSDWNTDHTANFTSAGAGAVTRTLDSRIAERVSVKDFGAIGNNVNDDTAEIQAAIDYAFSVNIRTVYMPSGNYKTSSPIYLDHPSNRADPTNPVTSNFSMALVGDPGGGNHNNFASCIRTVTKDFIALFVGPGQGMYVSSIAIVGPSDSTYRVTQPSTGVGIGIAGGSSGASRTLIENCMCENFFYGYKTGANGKTTLCDANTFRKCFASQCYIGINILATQNYIDFIEDCQVSDCGVSVDSTVGKPIWIIGGNYSTTSTRSNTFTISSVSALTDLGTGPNGFAREFTFTAIVTAPDANIAAGIYDSFALNTTPYGVIPCSFVSWNAGASTVTLKIAQPWTYYMFGAGSFDILANTDLQAQVQACTTLYASETTITFKGGNFHVQDVHIENPTGVTCFWSAPSTTTGSYRGCFKDITFNYNTALGNLSTSDPRFLIQQVIPFMSIDSCTAVTIENWSQVNGPDFVLIEWTSGQSGTHLYAREIGININMRVIGIPPSNFNVHTRFGGGRWEQSESGPPSVGTRLASWTSANVPLSSFRSLIDSAPAAGTFGPIQGQHQYQGTDLDINNTANKNDGACFVRSRHNGWSFGQNFAVTSWSYVGQSTIVRISGANTSLLFNGLSIILNNGVTGDQEYVIVGEYPSLGYWQVFKYQGTTFRLDGDKLTTFTDTTIKQAPYNFDLLSSPITCQLNGNYTLTNSNVAQKAFNASTNGAVSLSVGMYDFEAQYLITNTGTASHSWSTLFAGSATYTMSYSATAYTATGNVLTAPNIIYATSNAATVVTAPSTSATENVVIILKGRIRVTVTGTIIPQIKLDNATGVAATMLANSFIKLTPVSVSAANTFTGNWS